MATKNGSPVGNSMVPTGGSGVLSPEELSFDYVQLQVIIPLK